MADTMIRVKVETKAAIDAVKVHPRETCDQVVRRALRALSQYREKK